MPITNVYFVRCDYCNTAFTHAHGESKALALQNLSNRTPWVYISNGNDCFAVYCPSCWKKRENQESEIEVSKHKHCSCSPNKKTTSPEELSKYSRIRCRDCGRSTGNCKNVLEAARIWNKIAGL